MQISMPKCTLSVRSGQADLPLIPMQFEFRFHYDDRDERYPKLSSLMDRLHGLGFACRVVPVSGVCSFQLARAVVPSLNNTMIEFTGGGAQWLESLVTALEGIARVNASECRDQFYDPCSI